MRTRLTSKNQKVDSSLNNHSADLRLAKHPCSLVRDNKPIILGDKSKHPIYSEQGVNKELNNNLKQKSINLMN